MRILEELFTTISEFRKYAPYAESNVTFDQLNSSAISAKKQMVIILTKDVYTELTADEGELKRYVPFFGEQRTMAQRSIVWKIFMYVREDMR